MIDVLIERNKNGMLLALCAKGHAGYATKGFDIVCSAVSVLIRTTVQTLQTLNGIELELKASKRGFLSFKVKDFSMKSDENRVQIEQKLIFAGDFLETGLKSVSDEYPDYVKVVNKTVL